MTQNVSQRPNITVVEQIREVAREARRSSSPSSSGMLPSPNLAEAKDTTVSDSSASVVTCPSQTKPRHEPVGIDQSPIVVPANTEPTEKYQTFDENLFLTETNAYPEYFATPPQLAEEVRRHRPQLPGAPRPRGRFNLPALNPDTEEYGILEASLSLSLSEGEQKAIETVTAIDDSTYDNLKSTGDAATAPTGSPEAVVVADYEILPTHSSQRDRLHDDMLGRITAGNDLFAEQHSPAPSRTKTMRERLSFRPSHLLAAAAARVRGSSRSGGSAAPVDQVFRPQGSLRFFHRGPPRETRQSGGAAK